MFLSGCFLFFGHASALDRLWTDRSYCSQNVVLHIYCHSYAQNKASYSEERHWLLSLKSKCIKCICRWWASKHKREPIFACMWQKCVCCWATSQHNMLVCMSNASKDEVTQSMGVHFWNWQHFGICRFVSLLHSLVTSKNAKPHWSPLYPLQKGNITLSRLWKYSVQVCLCSG